MTSLQNLHRRLHAHLLFNNSVALPILPEQSQILRRTHGLQENILRVKRSTDQETDV